jgi:hypothetical protein
VTSTIRLTDCTHHETGLYLGCYDYIGKVCCPEGVGNTQMHRPVLAFLKA